MIWVLFCWDTVKWVMGGLFTSLAFSSSAADTGHCLLSTRRLVSPFLIQSSREDHVGIMGRPLVSASGSYRRTIYLLSCNLLPFSCVWSKNLNTQICQTTGLWHLGWVWWHSLHLSLLAFILGLVCYSNLRSGLHLLNDSIRLVMNELVHPVECMLSTEVNNGVLAT